MTPDKIIQSFAHALSANLDGASIANLRELGEVIRVIAKEIAWFQVSDNRLMVFVAEGAAKLAAHVGPDREQVVAFAFAGEILHLSPASPTPYELHALTDCRLVAFPVDQLVQALAVNTQVADALFAKTLSALDRARERTVLIGRKNAQERTASFLLDMGERIGTPKDGTIFLTLPISRREIADSLGLTIETISRQLTELRESGAIQTRGRSGIELLDLKQLRELASRAR